MVPLFDPFISSAPINDEFTIVNPSSSQISKRSEVIQLLRRDCVDLKKQQSICARPSVLSACIPAPSYYTHSLEGLPPHPSVNKWTSMYTMYIRGVVLSSLNPARHHIPFSEINWYKKSTFPSVVPFCTLG